MVNSDPCTSFELWRFSAEPRLGGWRAGKFRRSLRGSGQAEVDLSSMIGPDRQAWVLGIPSCIPCLPSDTEAIYDPKKLFLSCDAAIFSYEGEEDGATWWKIEDIVM